MFRLLFLLFLTVPLLELYLLIQIGNYFGAMPTIALCVFTAALGAALLRHQGLQTLARVQNKLQQGEMPATEVIGGLILLFSGIFLLTPGLFTDIIGFICLVPQFRNYVARGMLANVLQKRSQHYREGQVIVEGECWEENAHKRLGD
ncbi:MAG: UPF0716 protein FxsA [Gammaproteobacteria bacterium]